MDRKHKHIEAIYPLSPVQQGLLFHTLYAAESGVYVEQFCCTLDGDLDVSAFQRAWRRMIERHAVLRTLFVWERRAEPLQVVRAATHVELPWEVDDWREQTQSEQAARLDAFLQADRERSFDLSKAPLLRLALIQTGAARYAFVATHHHLLLDGWSQALLLTEVFACYRAFQRGQEPVLAPERPYREYIAWLQQQELSAAEAFWRQALAGFVAPTPFGVDRRATTAGLASRDYADQHMLLALAQTAVLQTFARQQQLTLNTLVQNAWALVLSRYSREADVLFGAVISSRPAALAGVETMIGLFINTLPVRVPIPSDERVLPWLKRLQARQAELRQYEYSPPAQVRAWSEVPRELPLFESIVAFENIPADASIFAQVEGLEIRDMRYLERTNYPLILRATPGPQLSARIIYDAGRFDAATITRLLGHLATVLEGFVAEPGCPLGDVPLLTRAERRQLLDSWNAPVELPQPQAECLHRCFEAYAARMPDAVAVVFDDRATDEGRATKDESADSSVVGRRSSGMQLTYAELNQRANQLAHHLRGLGVVPDVLVALCLEPSITLVVAILGVLKAGGAYLPLDPAYPPERLAFMLADAQARILLTASMYDLRLTIDNLEASQTLIVNRISKIVNLDTDWDVIAQQPADNPSACVSPDNLAYLIYTSGSTGTPKGVAVGHRQVLRLFAATQAWFQFDERDAWTLFHSYAFDFSVWELWGALLHGGRLVVVPYWISRQPVAFHTLLCDQQVTVLNQTPTAFRQLMQAQAAAASARLRLRLVIFGGEALDIPGLRPWFERHGDQSPQLVNMYGITETTIHVTYRPLTRADAQVASSRIGRRIPDLQTYILDSATLQPVPIGVAGELFIGGAGLARGYLNRPDLTAERFVPNPFAATNDEDSDRAFVVRRSSFVRLYKTGDLARYMPDGDIEYLGRVDHQVKIRGFRIELDEIAAAFERHPAVREALVLAREAASGDRRLVAYVVPREDQRRRTQDDHRDTLDRAPTTVALRPSSLVSELREHLQQRLPEYMLPAAIMLLDEWPLTPNGKLDRAALPAPDRTRIAEDAAYVAPSTREEQILTEIWSEVLDIAQVSVHDSFFALGGDSIRSLHVLSRVREQGFDLSLQQLFQHQTPYAIARALSPQQPGGQLLAPEPFSLVADDDRARLPAGVEDAYPLTMLQWGMLFHSAYSLSSALYHDVFSFHLRAPLDLQALTVALTQLAARHPVLRTSFDLQRFSTPLQLVHQTAEIPLAWENLSDRTAPEQEAAHAAWLEAEQRRSFDWASAPLLRIQVHRRSDSSFQLSLSFHHAILDGWSVASLLTELFQRYFRLLARETPPSAPPLPALFREFVALERAIIASEAAQRYWADALDQVTPAVLPRWPGATKANERQVRVHTTVLPAQLIAELQQLAQSAQVPLKSVLLAGHLRVMSLLGGQTDLITGLVSNGRPEEADGERVLGLFLNTLPLRMSLGGGTWRDLVRATFAAEQALLPLRRYPLAEIQRRSAGQPLFETAFNYVHFHVYQGLRQFSEVELLGAQFFEETNFPLVVTFSQEPASSFVQLRLSYDRAVLGDEQIAALSGYYLRGLHALAADPEARYDGCALLSEQERRQLLLEWNDTRTSYPRDRCIHELFEAQVERSPDAAALVFAEQHISYRELNRRANQLARYLRTQGAAPDVCVGVCMERSTEMIVAFLGILKVGAAYLPLDPAYPAERLAFMLADSQAAVVLIAGSIDDVRLTSDDLETPEPPIGNRTSKIVHLNADWPLIAQQSTANPDRAAATALHAAYVIYTSGSTGAPKGVLVPQGAVARLVLNTNYVALSASDRMAQVSNATFDAATFEIWGALLNGAALVGMAQQLALSLWEFAAQLHDQRITVMFLTTALFNQVAREAPSAFGAFDTLLVGGEAVDPQWMRVVLRHGPPRRLLNGYGPTETTTFAMWFAVQAAPDEATTIPIGRPLANTRAYLLDHWLQPVPVGVPGELYLGGDGLARGYLNRPDLTAERFVPNPFATPADERRTTNDETDARPVVLGPSSCVRLYRTGDLARYRPDGNVEFLGRLDQQVKLRGFRVEPGEIEAILRRNPLVQETVVLLREDIPGDKRLVAYMVPQGDERRMTNDESAPASVVVRPASCVSELRAFLAERLPEYMLPSAFVLLDALPLTPNGKVDRRALPPPDQDRPLDSPAYLAPRTADEARLAEIWATALGIARVGLHDNFFELGGHSLLALQVISKIRATFEVEVPLRRLFELPTLAELASEIASQQAPQRRSELRRTPLIPRRSRSIDQQLADLHDLSDDEARRLLDPASALDAERDAR
jgi:amino acid adenylation domain-containing protein